MTSFEIWRRLQEHQTVRPLPSRSSSIFMLGRNLLVLAGALLLTCAGLGVIGYSSYQGLSRSDFFQITDIKIEGCKRTTKEQIVEMSGVDIHTSLLALDAAQVEARLEKNGWIEQARLDRYWPNQLIITIRERTPVALIALADGLHFVDREGAVFAPARPPADFDLPVITGLEGKAMPGEGDLQPLKDALQLIRMAARGNPALPQQNISEINVAGRSGLTMYLVDRPFPVRLGTGEMGDKYHRLVKVLDWLYRTGSFTQSAYIQLDYRPDQVLVGIGEAGISLTAERLRR